MTTPLSLARGHLASIGRGHRASLPWRRHNSTSSATHRRTKSFIKRYDENGEIYYTVATKEEGKDMPKQPEILFEMPDLLLDLDAATFADGDTGVREFTADDEWRHSQDWRLSPKRLAVKQRLSQMSSSIAQTRQSVLEILNQPAHPMHIMDHDILSAALRGMTTSAMERENDFLGSKRSSEAAGKPEAASERRKQPKTPVINKFSHIIDKDLEVLPRPATLGTEDLVAADEANPFLTDVVEQGDPRKRPDYMRDLRVDNGIPGYAAKDDEGLIRWMMLRQDNRAFFQQQSTIPPPTHESIVNTITSLDADHTKRRTVSRIRRTIFNSLASGADLRITADDAPATNVPLAMRDQLAQILDEFADNYPPHFEVLTFVNNLSERLPQRDSHMCMALIALRLRALAGLGLINLATAQLKQGLPCDAEQSTIGLSRDILAALGSWSLHLEQNPVIQTQYARRALFCQLTGFEGSGETMSTSYRDLILQSCAHHDEEQGHYGLASFGRYIEILGKLGAVRSLWREWRDISEAIQQNDISLDHQTSLTESFSKALSTGIETARPSDSIGSNPSFEECAAADLLTIGPYNSVSEETEGAGGQSRASKMKAETLAKMLDLPLDQYLERIQKQARRLSG